MKIVSILEKEQNDYADSSTCRNGGGYFQPLYTIALDNGATVVISDTSCGDFGSRISATYTPDGATEPTESCYYGSMLRDDEWESDIPDDAEWLDLIWDSLGYNIPTVSDIE